MIRKLLIVAFVVAMAGSSFASAAAQVDGGEPCVASCCRAARHNKPRANLTRLCCFTECSQPAERQEQQSQRKLGPQRESRIPVALVANGFDSRLDSPSRFVRASAPTSQKTDLYLRTCSLLI